ncbi:quinate 5-dehydrogenase, protein [Mollisia scopiformis]|uniref:Quinate 5-dehydrogenase, protein n=1 Tax=Mollisia scopiformis TaxID=149040 RepID=A0A194XSN9_MOLSC|nr:quinate 5-dehydrogenase, protein [Mollisia scopiformis]KUJ23213.1 quinate 5-dehydrogenase, protein [Mollisia scopiformis]
MTTTEIETLRLDSTTSNSADQRKYVYLAGVGVTHSIGIHLHNYVAKSLGLPWTFINQECPTVEDVMAYFRAPTFAGGVVTMPYKKSIMPFLDELDPLAITLGACNNVYLTKEGKLRGTNTDWRGIKGCLLSGTLTGTNEGKGKPALVIGAGGASRAAVYALFTELECGEIYVVNRDAKEVEDLLEDSKAYASGRQPKLRHVNSVADAEGLQSPFYIVGTVPDFEARTEEELKARAVLATFLQKEEKGVLLDMCFKPRNTRILQMGKKHGWRTVEGTDVIGFQQEEQWRLWAGAGENGRKAVPMDEVWQISRKAAEESLAINF